MSSSAAIHNGSAKTKAQQNAIKRPNRAPICKQMRGFIGSQCLFSHDSSLLFLYSYKTIYVHSVQTTECICSLIGHHARITSLLINPTNRLQLMSMDESGTIKIWDHLRSKCVQTIDVASAASKWHDHQDSAQKYPTFSLLAGCSSVESDFPSTASSKRHFVFCVMNQRVLLVINIKSQSVNVLVNALSEVWYLNLISSPYTF